MSELNERLAKLSPAKRRLLQRRLHKNPAVAEPIAIVGVSCRLPGAENVRAFWDLLRRGEMAISEIPRSRWNVDELYDPTGQANGKMSTRWGAFLDGVDQFDAAFFGISPREAAKMDPQQRLLLEVAWEALESGGIAPDTLAGSASGVFIGIGATDYSKVPAQLDDYLDYIDAHGGTGNALSIAANRLSYVLDLHGPSLSVDTACSSALVAVHLAVESLRRGECEMALAGGVNVILTPEATIAFSKAHMLSPDGRCRPFDAQANGYVRGEGCGVVVLKRLSDAVAANDPVLAVIRGTAVNQDGRTSGITAPNGRLQQQAIRAALDTAGIAPDRVRYIEAHGTGTPLGDPIEVQALAELFRKQSPSDPACWTTSVKANIGHLETASGIAGLIKTLLIMQHGEIPPQLHLQEINPHIDLTGSRLVIPREAAAWESDGQPRIAGVSSFGFGGTNAHVVLEQAAGRASEQPTPERPVHLLTLSAKSEGALRSLAGRYGEHLEDSQNVSIADVCYTAAVGRSHLNHRLATTAHDREELVAALREFSQGRQSSNTKSGRASLSARPRVAFLFTGQGSQYVDMGRELFATEPLFRRTLEQCEEILHDQMDQPLLSLLYAEPGHAESLHETIYTQPALFALEYALARLWMSWGITPHLVLGHSLGEYAAACVAGAFTLEEGLRLVADRGRLVQQLPADEGRMAVVFAPEQQVEDVLAGYGGAIAIAASNGPENTVISGTAEAVDSVLRAFTEREIRTQPLMVSHAFHSPLMNPILDDFEKVAADVTYCPPQVPLVSNVSGRLLHEGELGPGYWRQHMQRPVRFFESVLQLEEHDLDAVIEIGPSTTLLSMARRCVPEAKLAWLPSLRKGNSDCRVLLKSLSELYVLGSHIDWRGFERDRPRRRVLLPTYPFERSRHWIVDDPPPRRQRASHGAAVHPLLGAVVPCALESTVYEQSLSAKSPHYLSDHQAQGSPVFPAAAYVEQALAAASAAFGPGGHEVRDVSIQQAMFLPSGGERSVQATVSPESAGQRTISVFSRQETGENKHEKWALHAAAVLCHEDTSDKADAAGPFDVFGDRWRTAPETTQADFYDRMQASGLNYGPSFRVLDNLRRREGEALAEVVPAVRITGEFAQYHLHPVLLDACFQAMAGVVPAEEDDTGGRFSYLPVFVRRARIHRSLGAKMYVYAVRTSEDAAPGAETVEGNVYLLDQDGQAVVELSGVRIQRVGHERAADERDALRDWYHRLEWVPDETTADKQPSLEALSQFAWLIFADRKNIAQTLAQELHERGAPCFLVGPGEHFTDAQNASPNGATHFQINPLDPSHYARVIGEVAGNDRRPLRVVYLWGLDEEVREASDWQVSASVPACAGMLELMQHLARQSPAGASGIWIATRGAQYVGGELRAVQPLQTSLWGLGRVAAIEHPELRPRLVDLDPDAGAADAAAALVEELATEDGENQVAYRGSTRFLARLERLPELAAAHDGGRGKRKLVMPATRPFQLRFDRAGSFDSLQYKPSIRQPLEADQVEVEMKAAGLNFSDVLKAMGLYPGIQDDVVPLGIEGAGIVTAVGRDVERFQVGDEVMGVLPYGFASHARTAEYTLVPKPTELDEEDASTISITFLTAYHALCHLAHLSRGERVLIHAGAGGVGLAAIQIAQQVGAEIFATAGSEEKREFLRSLGVTHVMNSRTLEFAEEIMRLTERRGVDVVLNSLPGEAMSKSLSLLAPYGRFLEIGKIDIYQNRMIGLLPFQDNLSYHAIDLDRLLRQRPEYVRRLFAEVIEQFRTGAYQPLPKTVFAAEEVVDAFRYMAQRKNIGKVVVSFGERTGVSAVPDSEMPLVREDGTYLITGGLGALGRQVAEWLISKGARNLVLLARRAPSGEAAAWLAQWRGRGAQVIALQADVSRREPLQTALSKIPEAFPPLRGVMHCAGVLEDSILLEMTPEQLERVMAPKAEGAWNLHRASMEAPLDFFVLFSSVAGLVGSPGQANYAAANAFLDGLAHYRRSTGRPALSVNWGPWADSGMAAREDRSHRLDERGVRSMPGRKALHALENLLHTDEANIAVVDADWREVSRQIPGETPAILRHVAPAEDPSPADAARQAVDSAFRDRLLEADAADRKALVLEYMSRELAEIMGLNVAALDVDQPADTLGLDSLMALELKNKVESQLAVSLPMAWFLESPSIRKLADQAAGIFDDPSSAAAAEEELPGRPGTSSWSPLVPLRKDGGAPPLFCFHPLGGDVRCYHHLARSCDMPVYAIRARGTDSPLPPHESIEEMAADYVNAIRGAQPEGPYCLAGWSTGGIYAYAVAERLRQEQDALGLLVFFDTPLPSVVGDVNLNDDAEFLCDVVEFTNQFASAAMEVSYERIRDLSPDDRLEVALQEARKHGVVPADAPAEEIRRRIEVAKANVRVLQQYRPGPLDQVIRLFRPHKKGMFDRMRKGLEPDLGWNRVTGRPLHVEEVPGDHFSMMIGDNALKLAQLIAEKERVLP